MFMNQRTHKSITMATIGLLFSLFVRVHAESPEITKRFTEGSLIPLAPGEWTLKEIVSTIHKETGTRIHVMDRFKRPDRKLLSQTISGNNPASFWSVIRNVMQQTGLEIERVDRNALTLSKPTAFDLKQREKKGGPQTSGSVQGAFFVQPVLDKFFERTEFLLYPEPWIHALRDLKGVASFDIDGLEERSRVSAVRVHREISGHWKFEFEPKAPAEEGVANRVDVILAFSSVYGEKVVQSPPLKQLGPAEPPAIEGLALKNISLRRGTKTPNEVTVELKWKGGPAASRGPDAPRLVLQDGRRIETASARSSSFEPENLSARFPLADPVRELTGATLEFVVWDVTPVKLGPVSTLAGKSFPAGDGTLKVAGMKERFGETTLKLDYTASHIANYDVVDEEGNEYVSGSSGRTGKFEMTLDRETPLDQVYLTFEASKAKRTFSIPRLDRYLIRPLDAGFTKLFLIEVSTGGVLGQGSVLSQGDEIRHRFIQEGPPLAPGDLVLHDAQGNPVKATGHSHGGSALSLQFPPTVPGLKSGEAWYQLKGSKSTSQHKLMLSFDSLPYATDDVHGAGGR